MKKIKNKAISLILVAFFAITVLSISSAIAYAGESKTEVGNGTISETTGINSGNWYYTNIDREDDMDDGHVVFNNKDVIMSAKTLINSLKSFEIGDCFKSEFSLTFTEISETGIGVGVGVKRINFSDGYKSAIELRFSKDQDGVLLKVKFYDADGQVLSDLGQKSFSKGVEIPVKVKISSFGDIFVGAGNPIETVVDTTVSSFEPSGYFGFKSTVGTVAKLNSVDLTYYRYDNAVNTGTATENFDNGYFNSNIWYTSHINYRKEDMTIPDATMKIVDGELLVENSRENCITTIHQYSNFEFSLDITKMRRESYVKDGVTYPVSEFFGFGIGIEPYTQAQSSTIQNHIFLHFDKDNNRFILYEEDRESGVYSAYKVAPFPAGYNLWSQSDVNDRVVNLKLKMVDGLLELFIKYADEEWNETPAFFYDLGFTPLGSVRFLGSGRVNYFAIDNLSIKNLDKNAEEHKVTVEYKKNLTESEKYEYTDKWDDADLLNNKKVDNSGWRVALIVCSVVAGLGVISFAGILIIKKRRK